MLLRELSPLFATKNRIEAIGSLRKSIKKGTIKIEGLAGSAAAMLMAGTSPLPRPIIAIAEDPDSAGYLYSDLAQMLGEDAVKFMPSGFKRDIRFGQPDAAARILRTDAIESFNSKKVRFIVSYPEALAEKVPLAEELGASTLSLHKGDKIILPELRKRLLDLGFSKTDYVYEPGQFAIRGSIIDIFSYSNELPYRLDLFDDELDSIRTFDIETQLSVKIIENACIIPNIESGQTGQKGISMLEFAGENTEIWCQSLQWLISRINTIANGELSSGVIMAGEGETDAMEYVVDAEDFERRIHRMRIFEFGNNSPESEYRATFDLKCSPQTLYHKNFDLISDSFSRMLSEGYRLFILSQSESQTERLKTIFKERGEEIPFTPVEGTIHAGYLDIENRNAFLTDHQIFDRFHKYRLKNEHARSGKLALSLKELQDLETGDFIVHQDHGIGRFGGLVRTTGNGTPQEMIKLIYSGDDIILVSIHSLHKLSKYRGKEGVPPKINKLGTGAWHKLKERTKAKVKDIARDLIKLYAARKEEKGFAFSPDTYMQHELEASFMYEDTPDQIKTVTAIKEDMQSGRPMDRLVCGDVGFGKTEIAIRAAFKAAVDGKQTAVLVPTTVLAMQHFRTFSERLKEFPVKVELLSRTRKPKEVKNILSGLSEGKIDIIIGTHKLIGKDVAFHDLGLLIIDEEQKFGVAVKEKLKQIKVNVDTLTMSATPIPRTLQFSLMGARDLSSLNTPPANRHPVTTIVDSFCDETVAEAVGYETSRGGQVFFICNRIERHTEIKSMLERLVPGVKAISAHGQMPPEKLEKAILDFSSGDYEVLIATTIVENGIDMPSVNTIIVSDAQNYGLSELHQLRGRVGRSSRKAFCYLLTPPSMPLTPVARRRLQAIESFSDLGSGIHIAMQDLDIRGAGNLLGAEQSGFIADLGYETYQRILKEAVIELRDEEFPETFEESSADENPEYVTECVVESDLELLLPQKYVPQENERISLYRRLDNMETDEQTEQFRKNLRDRFGPVPPQTEELILIVPLRRMAKALGIERLHLKNGKMFAYFPDMDAYYQSRAFGKIIAYLQKNPARCSIRDIKGKRSIVYSNVKSVTEAVGIISEISGQEQNP